jgi:plasmid replication initiation protein
MSDEVEKAPENPPTVVVPTENDYVVQSNLISRSAYRMNPIQRRLLFLATARVQADSSGNMSISMHVGDVVQALGMDDSGRSYRRVRDALKGLMGQVLHIEHANGDWELFHWVSYARYVSGDDRLDLEIHRALRPYILELQGQFSRIEIRDFGRLQGRHSQRIFELLMSASGHEGRQGNPRGRWWYHVETDRLRELLVIGDGDYKRTSDFRRFVVDEPVREINEADIGIHVTVEYHRRRRRLVAFTFHVERVSRDEPRPVRPATESETDDEKLIRLNPQAWAEALAEAEKQTYMPGLPREAMVRAEAWERFSVRSDLKRPQRGG